jgi:glyoxylase-like metal-dependent hydrolase (beta-lactamase superfamily II)
VNYRVDLLPVGRATVPGPQIFWMSDWFVEHDLCFQVALIRGGDVVALVNTGTDEDISVHTRGGGFFGEGASMAREEGEFIIDQLAAHGVAPADVTHIVLAPLTQYAAANVNRFPNAQIAISKAGWVHFHTTHEHPHDDHDTLLPRDLLVYLVADAWPRVRLLEPEDELAPGIRTWDTGGHHRSSLCVEVETARGDVAITDAVFVHGNLDRNHPVGICSNIEEAIVVHRRLIESGATVLPLYDPGNFERFPAGEVAP